MALFIIFFIPPLDAMKLYFKLCNFKYHEGIFLVNVTTFTRLRASIIIFGQKLPKYPCVRYEQICPNEYLNIFGYQRIDQKNLRIYLDA